MFLYTIFVILKSLICVLDCIDYLLVGYMILGWIALLGLLKNRDGLLFRIYVFLVAKIEPYLSRIRKFIPPIFGLDFSILVVFIGIHIAKAFIIQVARTILS